MGNHHGVLAALTTVAACAASPTNTGVAGTPQVQRPDVPGTIFTIVFENENQDNILPVLPFFTTLANENSQAAAYLSSTHPSLPNYIVMMSGSTYGISNDNDPRFNIQIGGSENLPDQMEAAGVPWRAYMESMGEPCTVDSIDPLYTAHHDPFLYFTSMATDHARCVNHVVDFDQNFTADLASGAYRYMWISPNTCNDLHNCAGSVGDAWLQRVVTQIMASPGYQNGGALFVLFDEGNTRYLNASANLATIVASPNLAELGYISQTSFDHRSYLAAVEDILRLPRLATTKSAVSMDEFFKLK